VSQFEFNPLTGKFDIVGSTVAPVDSDSAKRLKQDFIAGEQILALRFVYSGTSGKMFHGSRSAFDSSKVIGLAINTADVDETVTVLMFGDLADSFFTGTASTQYYLGTNGTSTVTPPTGSGTLTRVGYTLKPGSFFVKIEEPINLA
jgi:hypothetical protein